MVYSIYYKFSIAKYLWSQFQKEIQQMLFLVERFVPLSSQPISKITSVYQQKSFQVWKNRFFSNFTYGIDHFIQKIVFVSCLYLFKKAQIWDNRFGVNSVKIKFKSSRGLSSD